MVSNLKPVTGTVQEKNGSWHAVLNVTDFETGKRKIKWQKIGKATKKRGDGGLTKTKAEALLPAIKMQVQEEQEKKYNEYSALEGMTAEEKRIYKAQNTDFYEYAKSYLEARKGSELHLSSYLAYQNQNDARVKRFFHGKYKVKDVTYSVLQDFFNEFNQEGCARSTKTRYKAFLKLVIDDAVTKDVMPSNPIEKFPKGTFGKSDFKATTFKAHEIDDFLPALMDSDDVIGKLVAITFYYALRREEVLGWKWSQIDFERKTISLETSIIDVSAKLDKNDILKKFKSVNTVYSTKGRNHIVEQNVLKTDGSATVMPLLDVVIDTLKKIKEQTEEYRKMFGNCYDNRFSDYVFVRPDGYIITPSYVSSHFPILLRNLDMKRIRFHDVRHTTATLLLKEGWSIKHIQHWLRHSDAQTTAKFYLHTDEEELVRVGAGVEDMYNKFTTKKEITK